MYSILNILLLMPPHFAAKKKLIVNVHLKKRNIHKRKIHSGSDDHLKWRSSVIGSYPQWQVKEPQGR